MRQGSHSTCILLPGDSQLLGSTAAWSITGPCINRPLGPHEGCALDARLTSGLLQGAVLVHLKCCEDMSAADDNGLSDPYVTLKLGKTSFTSAIMYRTCDPIFDTKYDWAEVSRCSCPGSAMIWKAQGSAPQAQLGCRRLSS